MVRKKSKKIKNFMVMMKKIKPYMCNKRTKINLFILTIFLIITSVVSIEIADITRQLTDLALSRDYTGIKTSIILVLTVVIIGIISSCLSNIISTKFINLTQKEFKINLLNKTIKSKIAILDKENSGDIFSIISDNTSSIVNLVGSIPMFITQICTLIIVFIYLWIINYKLLLAVFMLMPFTTIIYNKLSAPMQNHYKTLAETNGELRSELQNVLDGIEVVKTYNAYTFFNERLKKLYSKYKEVNLKISRINFFYLTPIYILLRFTPQIICPLYGGYLISINQMTVGELLAYNILIWFLIGPIESFLGYIVQVKSTIPSMERVIKVIDWPCEEEGQPFVHSNNSLPILFKNVVFSYDSLNNVLDNVSFKLNKNQIVEIVGPSGSGKSTIFRLLSGYYEMNQGEILIYDNEYSLTDISSIRDIIAYVTQESNLFNTTIYENIRYGNLNASTEEIIEAAKLANAHEFIMDLSDKYQTVLSENGSNLSVGQKQRINLARAFVKQAPILLLDEPTSSLDAFTTNLVEKSIRDYVTKYHASVLIVTHMLSNNVDWIYVLDKGKIIESGNHDELIKLDGLYSCYYMKQKLVGKKEAVDE